jgi:MFS family permease
VRALAIAFFYAIGTGIGGVAGPWLFGVLIDSGSRWSARDLGCADFLASPAFGRLLVADTAFTLRVRLLLVISDSSRRF